MRARDVLRSVPLLVWVVLVLAPAFAVLHATAPDVLSRLTREDGVVEYGQALGFAVAGALFLARFVHRRGRDPWSLLLGAGLVVVAGEEISWGQRIFGIDTPGSLEGRNVQNELNLHNLDGIHQNVRALGMVVLITLFVLIPLGRQVLPLVRDVERRLALPLVPLWAVPLALVALAYMVVPRALDGVVFALDEVGELYVALTAVGFAAAAWAARAAVAPAVAEEPVLDLIAAEAPPATADAPATA